MNTIKFSHPYLKLHAADIETCYHAGEVGTATLLFAQVVDKKDLHEKFIEYDTVYRAAGAYAHYELKGSKFILMIFKAEDGGIFTTMRPAWPTWKVDYYLGKVGEEFTVVIE